MHRVVPQKVRAGFDRASGVYFYDLHVIARCFCDMRECGTADAAKAVDAKRNGHGNLLKVLPLRGV